MLIENKLFTNFQQQKFLNYVMSPEFPWYYTTSGTGVMIFAHTLLSRNRIYPYNGDLVSNHWEKAEDIFLSFCEQNKINVKSIYRACFNLTIAQNIEYSNIHVDHHWPHHNFILYLNDCTGNTLLFDDEENVVKEVSPEVNKVFIFEKQKHSNRFCLPGEARIILVITFDGEQYE